MECSSEAGPSRLPMTDVDTNVHSRSARRPREGSNGGSTSHSGARSPQADTMGRRRSSRNITKPSMEVEPLTSHNERGRNSASASPTKLRRTLDTRETNEADCVRASDLGHEAGTPARRSARKRKSSGVADEATARSTEVAERSLEPANRGEEPMRLASPSGSTGQSPVKLRRCNAVYTGCEVKPPTLDWLQKQRKSRSTDVEERQAIVEAHIATASREGSQKGRVSEHSCAPTDRLPATRTNESTLILQHRSHLSDGQPTEDHRSGPQFDLQPVASDDTDAALQASGANVGDEEIIFDLHSIGDELSQPSPWEENEHCDELEELPASHSSLRQLPVDLAVDPFAANGHDVTLGAGLHITPFSDPISAAVPPSQSVNGEEGELPFPEPPSGVLPQLPSSPFARIAGTPAAGSQRDASAALTYTASGSKQLQPAEGRTDQPPSATETDFGANDATSPPSRTELVPPQNLAGGRQDELITESAVAENPEDVAGTKAVGDGSFERSEDDHHEKSAAVDGREVEGEPKEPGNPLEGLSSQEFGSVMLSPTTTRSQGTVAQANPSSPQASPLGKRRPLAKTLSSRMALGTGDQENSSEDRVGEAEFWNEFFDVDDQDMTETAEADAWDVPDAELTLSQIDRSHTTQPGLHTTAAVPTDSRMSDSGSEREDSPPPPQAVPPGAFIGFSTGRDRKLPEPSAAALALARRAFAEFDGDGEEEGEIRRLAARSAARTANARDITGARSPAQAAPSKSQHHPASPEPEQPDEERPPAFVGFRKANNKAVALSESALQEAKRRMAAWEAEHTKEEAIPPKPARSEATSTNQVPTRSQPRVPERLPLQSVPTGSPRINDGASTAVRQPSSSAEECKSSSSPGSKPGATTLPSSLPSRVNTIKGETSASNILPPSTPGPSARAHLVTPARPATSRPGFQHSVSTTAAKLESPAPAGRPSLHTRPSRISLGMTPRAKMAATAGKQVFKTPFKSDRPQRPSLSSTQVGLSSPAVLRADETPSRPSAASAKVNLLAPARSSPPVFNMKAIAPRIGLRQYGMVPCSASDILERPGLEGVSTILKEPSRASDFCFTGPHGEDLTPSSALVELKRVGAHLVDLSWVQNHWSLILWKLAAYAQARPFESKLWWCFEEVMRQLRYRYEREVNLAQRSAVKRIQEHDSSAGLPMVLCVHGIRRRAHPDDEEPTADMECQSTKAPANGSGGDGGVNLVLTDGWYKIQANLDPCLSRAVQKGKIRLGQKLNVQGAKLDSYSASASDPMSAFDKASLSLNGNGTSLASWDARLGFHRAPMVATLRSLTGDGGVVPCMRIIVTRLFPVAYVDGAGGERMGGARGAMEEAEAQREWETRLEDCKARLTAENEKEMHGIRETIEAIAASSNGTSTPSESSCDSQDSPSQDIDTLAASILDDVAASSNPSTSLSRHLNRALGARVSQSVLLRRLYELAMRRAESVGADCRQDLERELQRQCPPRKVRSFRVCRFVDDADPTTSDQTQTDVNAVNCRPTLRRRCQRTVQLTVWDVDALPEGMLEQGGAYMVTNLLPSQRTAWRGPDVDADVFLSTRRDTKWKRIH